MFAVLKKELKSYFLTPVGYVFIGLFLIVVSFFFYQFTYMGQVSFEDIVWQSTMILTFITPVLTMRMFAEEKKNGTDQLILTSPRSLTSVVLGKFFAACFVILITMAFMFVYYGILRYFGKPSFIVAIVSLVGFFLLAMSYISFGMFASSITENQIVASVITIAFFFITSFIEPYNKIVGMFSLLNMYQKFPYGIIALREVVAYLSFTLLFILLTIIVLQRRKSVK